MFKINIEAAPGFILFQAFDVVEYPLNLYQINGLGGYINLPPLQANKIPQSSNPFIFSS
jgi:hypothetical protein